MLKLGISKRLLTYAGSNTSLIVAICTIVTMFVVTAHMRSNFNSRDGALNTALSKNGGVPVENAELYHKIDVDRGNSLYRKIWTYDALILVSGVLLISVARRRETKID